MRRLKQDTDEEIFVSNRRPHTPPLNLLNIFHAYIRLTSSNTASFHDIFESSASPNKSFDQHLQRTLIIDLIPPCSLRNVLPIFYPTLSIITPTFAGQHLIYLSLLTVYPKYNVGLQLKPPMWSTRNPFNCRTIVTSTLRNTWTRYTSFAFYNHSIETNSRRNSC